MKPVPKAPVFALLAFWSLTSLIAYPIAGEKMPWLTAHITFPLILLAAWGFQQMMSKFDMKSFAEKRGWLVMGLAWFSWPVSLVPLGSLLSSNPPFQGHELYQLRATGNFLSGLLVAGVSGFIVLDADQRLAPTAILDHNSPSVMLLVLVVLTTHTAVQAAYINYDEPTEYLVYAHGGRGIKDALNKLKNSPTEPQTAWDWRSLLITNPPIPTGGICATMKTSVIMVKIPPGI